MQICLPEPLQNLAGLEAGTITNIYGGPGVGKTNICLLTAIDCVKKNGSVCYIDTENGFSIERLKQLTNNWQNVLDKIELAEPKDFSQQGKIIRELDKKNTNLIIVDSIVAMYRLEYAESKNGRSSDDLVMAANRELSKQLSILSNIAKEKSIPVIITAHAFKSRENGEWDAIGGEVLKYWSKVIMFIDRTGRGSERKAVLIKHRHLAEGRSVKFQIVQEGIKPAGFKLF
jgi:DNA repair protein RadB